MPTAPSTTAPAPECPHCSYDLRGNTTDRCPECGAAVDDAAMQAIQVPWSARRELGHLPALILTAWRVALFPRRFCGALSRPIHHADARRFHLRIVFVIWVVTGLPVATGLFAGHEIARGYLPPAERTILALASLAGLGFFAFTATAVHTYWFHPRSLDRQRQQRAVALAWYACAPMLGLIPVSILGSAAFATISVFGADDLLVLGNLGRLLTMATWLGIAAVIIAFWRSCLIMAACAARRSPASLLTMAVTLPLLWLALAAVGLLGFPFLIGYLRLIAHST